MSHSRSVSRWIVALKNGDGDAAQRLWERYSSRLVDLAKRRLGRVPKLMVDEDDIAQSVFYAVCKGAENGRFSHITDRDELWWMLLAITKYKVVDYLRRENSLKRGGDGYIGGGAIDLDQLVGDEPTADLLATLDDQTRRLLSRLPNDMMRQIAIERIEGFTVPEIARHLDVSVRSVERKLKIIRDNWARDLSKKD